MEKEKANRIALAVVIVGCLIGVGVVEYLAYRVFGRSGVLIVSALSMWVVIMLGRSNR